MTAIRLVERTPERDAALRADLISAGAPPELVERHLEAVHLYRHGDTPPDRTNKPTGLLDARELNVSVSTETYPLERAHASFFGIVKWQRAVVSVNGALTIRLEDQRKIGRQRRGGERSPAPLPDWYELAHLVYDHAEVLGFDRRRAVYQYLPGTDDEYLNIAEALHLRQPR